MLDLTCLKVSVTQEDINLGCKIDACNCPVARAILRLLPAGYEVAVDSFVAVVLAPFGEGMAARRYKMHWAGRQFIRDFDAGREVFPVEFELEVAA